MKKEKKEKYLKIAVAVIAVVLVAWFFVIYPMTYFHKNEKTLKKAAEHYFEINYNELPTGNNVKTLSFSDLAKEKYVDDLYIPYTKKNCSVKDSWVKVRKEGDGYKYYTYLKCGYLSSSVDHEGPEITLEGEKEITIDKGEKYKEQGVKSVFDKKDKEIKVENVTIKNDHVNTNKLGTYKVTYEAYDSLENKTVVERTVKVVQKLSGVVNNDTGKKGYYTGTNVNNYLRLSGMLFRIYGVNNDGSVKIVSAEGIAHLNYDGIQNWLENYYYAHLTDKAKEFLTDGAFCSDKLATVNNATTCSEQEKKKKVGILSAEDYIRTIENEEDSYLYTRNVVWLANPKDDKEAWTVKSWFNAENGTTNYKAIDKQNSFIVRPALTIKKDVLIKGGEGTAQNPYTLGDLTKAKSNAKLNTRITGEYISYGGNKFRIIETMQDGTTKVIAENVLAENNSSVNIQNENPDEAFIYNPTKKGNVGYIIDHITSSHIKTDIFVKHEIETAIYKNYAIYGKTDSTKKYKVKFASPSVDEMFSAAGQTVNNSFWMRDSSKNEARKFLTAPIGNIFDGSLSGIREGGIRIVAFVDKDVTILEGKGTSESPYKLVK